MVIGTVTISLVMSAYAAPSDRNQPELAASPEYVELYMNAKACGETFPDTSKTVPAGMEYSIWHAVFLNKVCLLIITMRV
ncbi:hypothetical protein K7432_004055 [Basidiobolus ranarum]|uniref:Uncharacterized protein n=1 Tax=Basidiobolus ranarum TaxID=34480 RepID=A0ABR2WYW9_9FUNG